MTITEFLLARIAEDEAELSDARAEWMRGEDSDYRRDRRLRFNPDDMKVAVGYGRVLAECEAKRRIVDAYARSGTSSGVERARLAREHPNAAQYGDPEWYEGQTYGLAEAVQNLASVYVDHPDYRDEWRP